MFNIDNGYLEGLCRGFKNGILKQVIFYMRMNNSLCVILSMQGNTVCQRSSGWSDPFYIVSYNIKWFTTFWPYSIPIY